MHLGIFQRRVGFSNPKYAGKHRAIRPHQHDSFLSSYSHFVPYCHVLVLLVLVIEGFHACYASLLCTLTVPINKSFTDNEKLELMIFRPIYQNSLIFTLSKFKTLFFFFFQFRSSDGVLIYQKFVLFQLCRKHYYIILMSSFCLMPSKLLTRSANDTIYVSN